MTLTFLGTGTSQGVPVIGCGCEVCCSKSSYDKRLRTSALLKIGDIHILIDPGPDLRQQFLIHHVNRMDAVLVTHEHKDHIGGLDDIRPINFSMGSPIHIYGMRRALQVIEKDYDYAFQEFRYPGVPSFQLHPVYNDPFEIQGIEIIPIHVKHLSLPILGFRIGNFAYITDANFIPQKEKNKLQNLHTLVINALRHEEHYSHFCLSQALGIIHEIAPKYSYLTHISHEMGLYDEINPTLPDHVSLAHDGLKVEFFV